MILVVGESLVDIVHRGDGTTAEYPGGSPANVALALARLGRPTRLLTQIGDDARGHLVRRHLAASGVRLVEGSVTGAPTSTAVARLDREAAATYTFDLDWSLPPTAAPAADLPAELLAVHVGSIGAVLAPGAATVRSILRRAHGRTTTSYDPNLRPDLMGRAADIREQVESLVADADVVKLSEDDARWLAPDEDPVDLIGRWHRLGPAVVVLTRGGQGCLAIGATGSVEAPAEPVEVADTVGAGDAFMAGLLDGLWSAGLLGGRARPLLRAIEPDALRGVVVHAARVAGVTVSRPGANPPRRAELPPQT